MFLGGAASGAGLTFSSTSKLDEYGWSLMKLRMFGKRSTQCTRFVANHPAGKCGKQEPGDSLPARRAEYMSFSHNMLEGILVTFRKLVAHLSQGTQLCGVPLSSWLARKSRFVPAA